MSLLSMTGHGRGVASSNGVKVDVELSSVNRKQLDVSISLPRSLAALEPQVVEEIHRALSRGRINGEIAIRLSSQARRKAVCVDDALAETYLTELRKAAKHLKLKDDFHGSLLLTLPDVLRYEHPTDVAEKAWPLVSKALKAALKALLQMRTREGLALQKDLEQRLEKIELALERIKKQAPFVTEHYRDKLQADEFFETAVVHGYRYGSPKTPVIQALQSGKDVLMNLDVQGAATIRDCVNRAPPGDPLHRELIDIFVVPPSLATLKSRLVKRGKDTAETIARRLKQAEEEISHWQKYKYAVVNDDLAEAYDNMRAIILAERHKIRNRADDQ